MRAGRLRRAGDLGAEHELDDLHLAALLRDERADVAPVPEHGRVVAMGDHLAQAVRDEERGAASFLLRRHHREDALGEVGWERRRDLVEDQELRVARERAGEVEHPEQRQRQVGRLLGQVDLEVEVGEVASHLRDRGAREAEVLGDRQVGHERRVLEDGSEPDARSLGRRADPELLPVDGDRAAVRTDHAGQQLHERALAGAVRAEERVHLSRLDDERARGQRDDRAVALRELVGGEQAHRERSGRDARRRPSRVEILPRGPCSPRAARPCTSSTA